MPATAMPPVTKIGFVTDRNAFVKNVPVHTFCRYLCFNSNSLSCNTDWVTSVAMCCKSVTSIYVKEH